MPKTEKITRTYTETYVKDTYVPSKEDVIELIKKDKVKICIIERSKYSDGSEEMKLILKHEQK